MFEIRRLEYGEAIHPQTDFYIDTNTKRAYMTSGVAREYNSLYFPHYRIIPQPQEQSVPKYPDQIPNIQDLACAKSEEPVSEAKPLQIEEGKFYEISCCKGQRIIAGYYYKGTFNIGGFDFKPDGTHAHGRDIRVIREWIEPPHPDAPQPGSQQATRDEIIRRRNAIDASELDEHRKFARAILRIKTCRDYLQAECPHEHTKKVFQIGFFETRCEDCSKLIKDDQPCKKSS